MHHDKPEIVIVGAGGMGALFGAILAAGGLSVHLLDTSAEHVEAIKQDGLRIEGFGGDRSVEIAATCDPGEVELADLIVFQCKAHQTADATRAVRHLVHGDTVCISFQNGLGNEEIIAGEVGADRVLGGVTTMAGELLEPGRIRDFSRMLSWIGEMTGGISSRAEALAETFTAAGLDTRASKGIREVIWKKLMGNIALSAVSGATNLTSSALLAEPDLKALSLRALDEALAVAAHEGIAVDRGEAVDGIETISAPGGTGNSKSSLCVDLLNRRPTEVDFIYGTVIGKAREAGIPVPTLETLAAIVRGLESQYLEKRK